jgi:hypothetical protein
MRFTLILAALLPFATLAGCGDDGHSHDPGEVITTVTLTFTPMGGGAATTATFDDPDGPGGDPPTVDPVNLAGSTTYTLAVRFQNGLEEPPEEITDEVRDEGEDHQVFFTGTAVNGPASDQPLAPLTHTYADQDAGGLPLGLTNTIVTDAGTGTLTVTLRHLPPLNDQPVKTASAAADVKAGGFAALGGATDAQVDFAVTAGSPTPP